MLLSRGTTLPAVAVVVACSALPLATAEFTDSTAAAALSPSVLLEPHCDNSVRVRIAPPGADVQRSLVGALGEGCGGPPPPAPSGGPVTNGRVKVAVDSGAIAVSRADTDAALLSGPLPTFRTASCGGGYVTINLTLTGAPDRVYGLGQLESEQQSKDCSDGGGAHVNTGGPCALPLDRREVPGGAVSLTSVKYNIAVGFLYSTSGFGLFVNQPGDGVAVLPRGSGVYDVSFTCQKQLDLWVTVGTAPQVYASFAQATGPPAKLPDYAIRFWQSKDAYKDQAEVVALARNFSQRNLTVGVIVIDLGVPSDPPYYRLDPTRFPDVPQMAATVKQLTGAVIMPNLKPTSVRSADCPACGAGHAADGKADDGQIDPSTEACRGCVWSKRLKPELYDKGVEVYWLDDDEGNKFRPPNATFACGPAAYCGLWAAGTAWPSVFTGGSSSSGTAPLVLSRNLWAGAAALGAALWSSDIECSWTELRAQVAAGLASGLSGFPYWTSDVGGFFGTTTPELVARWHQFGSVCPIYRTHGSRPANEPWSFGGATEASIVKSIQLRDALHDYVAGLVANTSVTGAPMMRPLFWDFAEQPAAWNVSDAFMLGPRYLAAPVLDEGARTRRVWLPALGDGAKWTHYYTKQSFSGGGAVTVDAPYDELPLFVRGDA